MANRSTRIKQKVIEIYYNFFNWAYNSIRDFDGPKITKERKANEKFKNSSRR
jgi:hypothetical protein